MADDVIAEGQAVADGGAPLGAGSSGSAPTQEPQSAPTQAAPEQKTQQIPHAAMKRIKEEQYQRGINEGSAAALQQFARMAGYGSPEEMAEALKSIRSGGQTRAAQSAPTAKPPVDDSDAVTPEELARSRNERRAQGRYERQMERTLRERDQFMQQARENQRRLREAQEALDAKEAEMAIREVAVASGLKDVDYGLRLLTRHLEGMSSEELEQLDERAFFSNLRKEKPYLFGEVTQPATTGTGATAAPAPPKPGQAAATVAKNGQTDARKMSPQEYQEHMRKLGYNMSM